MGDDGNLYFADIPDEKDRVSAKRFNTGAEVFDRLNGVLTHNCIAHQTIGLPGDKPLRPTTGNENHTSSTISRYNRPQSAQQKTLTKTTSKKRELADVHASSTIRPQSSQRKTSPQQGLRPQTAKPKEST